MNSNLEKESFSKLNGKFLSFKDINSFSEEYSLLSEFKTIDELKKWISIKGHLSALDNPELVSELNDTIIQSGSYNITMIALFIQML